jgi:hypothetical protein
LNRLNQIARFRVVGHRFVLRNTVSHFTAADIFVKHFL